MPFVLGGEGAARKHAANLAAIDPMAGLLAGYLVERGGLAAAPGPGKALRSGKIAESGRRPSAAAS